MCVRRGDESYEVLDGVGEEPVEVQRRVYSRSDLRKGLVG